MRTVNPAFYLSADPDLDPGSQSNADPGPGHTLLSQKVEFLHENMLEVGYRVPGVGTGYQPEVGTGYPG